MGMGIKGAVASAAVERAIGWATARRFARTRSPLARRLTVSVRRNARTAGPIALPAIAVVATALAATAFAAVSIGALAILRLAVRNASIKSLHVESLRIDDLRLPADTRLSTGAAESLPH